MSLNKLFLVIPFITCAYCKFSANEKILTSEKNFVYCNYEVIENIGITCFDQSAVVRPSPFFKLLKNKRKKNKRVVAAILAFPFPFGIVGLHRIYLGTAPYVPVVYIGTVGGVLGILPFIDFCMIVLDKDLDRYSENKKIFMWVADPKPAVK
jgi:TM2 domain-containing membrane protein YozV